MNRVLTTGQVARIFSVNINTVIKWFDDGKLEGFRLPRSNERRIYRESVLAFMQEHGISSDLLREFDAEQNGRRRSRRSAPAEPARGAELRAFPRCEVELNGLVEAVEGEDVIGEVVVRNLSMGGAYVTGFRPGQGAIPEEFRLHVPGLGEQPDLEGTCQLIHLRRAPDQTLSFGCRFTRVDPGALQSYLVAN